MGNLKTFSLKKKIKKRRKMKIQGVPQTENYIKQNLKKQFKKMENHGFYFLFFFIFFYF
jgi:hypothetical protein